jgi:hypothetical protein
MSLVFQNIDPPPPSPPRECVLPPPPPPTKGGGYTLAGRRGGKTTDIGLPSYNNNLSTARRFMRVTVPDNAHL